MRLYAIVLLSMFVFGCAEEKTIDNPLVDVLNSKTDKIKRVVDSLDQYEVQIMYSEILRQNDSIRFMDYNFQIDDSTYFYPASTVKFPVALLALEKLNKEGLDYLSTEFFIEGDSIVSTFENDIKNIFAISDNEAYNRLFEYLGKDYINKKLEEKALTPVRISHRLSTNNAYELTTKPLIFYKSDTLITTEAIINSEIKKLQLKKIKKGKGYYSNSKLINEPFDFSMKNYLPITTLHDMMKRVIFPDNFPKKELFNLTKKQYEFVLKSMSDLPKDSGFTSEEYYNSYVKFFLFGDSKEDIPSHIKIYNKVGYAYGYLTDCAYIKDTKNNLEFILTATIHVNKDGIFNDDVYEYETIGIPFLAELGREIYNLHLEH